MTDVTTLIEALPYIREFRGKTFVVRCPAKLSDEYREALCRDLAMLRFVGIKTVLLHPHQQEESDNGAPAEGRQPVNHQLVHSLGAYGNATGLSGSDGAPRWLLSTDENGELKANADLALHVIDDYTPVIEAVAVEPAGRTQAANPDLAAAKLAVALDAYKLILVPGTGGVRVEEDGEQREVSEMRESGDVLSRIVTDPETAVALEASVLAISEGVRFAHVLRGDEPHGLLLELFTDSGSGTKIRSADEWSRDQALPECGYTLW